MRKINARLIKRPCRSSSAGLFCKNSSGFDGETAAKNTFKRTKVEGILTAYKLFYVGCSRARMNLIVIVDKNKVSNYEDQFIEKAEWAGFQIEKAYLINAFESKNNSSAY